MFRRMFVCFLLVCCLTTAGTAPSSPPLITSAFARNNSTLYVTWRNSDEVEVDVIGYEINYRLIGLANERWQANRVASAEARSVTIKQLKEQNVYEVRIKRWGCGGNSPFSKPTRVTTGRLDKPPRPQINIVNVTSHSANFTWVFPPNAWLKTFTAFEYQMTNVASNFTFSNENSTAGHVYASFDLLEPYTSYSFLVRAFNHEGPGYYSHPAYVTTLEDAPSIPINVTSSHIRPDRLTLLWKQPEICNGIIRDYDVEMQEDGGVLTKKSGNITSLEMTNLKEFTVYHFRVRGFTVKFGNWSNVTSVRTMCSRPLHSPKVGRLYASSPQAVVITWAPPPYSPHVGYVIAYKIIFTDDVRQNDQHWMSKIVAGEERNVTIGGLRSDTVYFFKIAGKTEDFGPFSEKKSERTDKLGLPPPPFDGRVQNVTSSSAIVGWGVKKGYRVTVVKIRFLGSGEHPMMTQLVDATVHDKATLSQLQPNSRYHIEIVASNYVGDSSGNPLFTFRTKSEVQARSQPISFEETFLFKVIIGVVVALVLVIVTMAIVIGYCKCRNKSSSLSQSSASPSVCPSHVEMDSVSTFLRASTFGSVSQRSGFISRSGTLLSCQSAHSSYSRAPSTNSNQVAMFPEQFILSWSDIYFEEISLGVGNFGQVVKATVRKENELLQSAVKTLKDGSTLEDKRDFLAELDLMSRIGVHRNVISLLGACEHDGSMYLCTEFAPNGNLLRFLRSSRRVGVEEGSYTTLSQTQLLIFASDVAEGMAYLSEKQIIHRDLAARNVLLDEDKVCKISDFGLSRGEGVYVKRTASRLPIRWMAIESLNYNVYTSKSDVWSYGVLLWEIVSLGGTPYCGMSCAELYEKLPAGYRMEKPLNCEEEFFVLMQQCWKDRPYERPTFTQLCVALDRMKDAWSTQNYVNTAIIEYFKFANIDVTEEEE